MLRPASLNTFHVGKSIISKIWRACYCSINFTCLLCYQASKTPVCLWCKNDLFFFTPSIHGENLLAFGPVANHIRHTSYQRLSILSLHTPPVTSLVNAFKFQHSLSAGRVLSQWFINKKQQGIVHKPALLLPVPISPWRLASRHYNQAAVLAQDISKAFAIPMCTNWAIRKGISSQHMLGKQARLKHANAIFKLTETCIDHFINTAPRMTRVAIIDDVITTGVTVDVLARMLKKRYPYLLIEVWAMTFTPPPKSSLLTL